MPDALSDAWDDVIRRNRVLQARNDPLSFEPPTGLAEPTDQITGLLNGDSLSSADWQRLRNRQLRDPSDRRGADEPKSLTDDQPMNRWQRVRDRQAKGLLPARWDGGPAQTAALSAAQQGAAVDSVVVTAPRPTATAAFVAGALNTIASGPNTSATIPNAGGFTGAVVRGSARDVGADGKFLGGKISARATLDPPTGRAEVSASGIRGTGIGLPPHVRVYTTPTGELDVDLSGPIHFGPLPIAGKGTYVIGQPDPPKKRK